MATVTKKYAEAIKIFPDLKNKKPLEVYGAMTNKGYDWDVSQSKWINETEKSEVLPIININATVSTPLADDTLEILKAAFEEFGLELINNPYPRPRANKDKKGNLIKSETESTIWFSLAFPDINHDNSEVEE